MTRQGEDAQHAYVYGKDDRLLLVCPKADLYRWWRQDAARWVRVGGESHGKTRGRFDRMGA